MVPAATILLVRDTASAEAQAAATLEVLMVQRHHEIDFASGALVFPGGKVAEEDSDPAWAPLLDGTASDAMRPFLIAAIREAFEESGLLLARPASARGVGAAFASPEALAPIEPLRADIAAGKASFLAAVTRTNLVLALDALSPFAHWITPEGMKKRFDTHFFIARAPSEQAALCDGGETVDACWVTPEEALAQAESGARTIIFPTRLNLEMLGRASNAEDALAAARGRDIVTVLPVVRREDGDLFLHIPPEAGYAVVREKLDGIMR